MFAKIKNGSVIEWPILNLTQLFPNISFPLLLKDSDMPEDYVIVKSTNLPSYSETQKIVAGEPTLEDGKWTQNWNVVDMTTQEFDELKNVRAQDVRAQRDNLLKESDWSQLPDVQVNKTLWIEYRQALRNITSQSGFPLEVEWPIAP